MTMTLSVPGAAPIPRARAGTGLDGQLVFGEARRVADPEVVEFFFGVGPNEVTNSQPAAISDANAFEFGYRVSNAWYVDFTSQGRVTLTMVVRGNILSIFNTFRSEAFVGLGPLREVFNNASVTATLQNDTLTLTWPPLEPGAVVVYQAVYELNLPQCVPGPLAACCNTNGTIKAAGSTCR